MNIVIFGSPGSGKGTQAVMLSKYLHLRRIVLGDILRSEVKKMSQLGQQVENYMGQGQLVPDALVSRVIEKNINTNGFILDGYPRNLNQAERLEQILKNKNNTIDIFLYLDIDQKTITDRLSKRRVCRSCGANYHLDNMPPKKRGICDSCGGLLQQRKDDTPEVIRKRWKVFIEQSQKILDFYQIKDKDTVIKIDARGNKKEVFERIKEKLQ